MADIANLQIKVKGQSDGASKSIEKLTGSLKKMQPEAAKSESSLSKLTRSLGRVAFYRAIRTAIRQLTGSINEGIKNLYAWDSMLGGTFSQSLDTFASASLNIKNAMGVAVAPFIEMLVPLFEKLSNVIMAAANAISRFFAIISGQSQYRKVIATTTKFADSTGTANANLKEMKRTLLGFDEINLLNDPSVNNGGAGNGLSNALSESFKMEDVGVDAGKLGDRIALGINKAINVVRSNMPVFEDLLGTFELGLGAILAFTGHPLIGIGMMALGAGHKWKASQSDWGGLNDDVVSAVMGLQTALGIGAMALGAVLAFSGANVPLGIGMIAVGAVSAGSAALNWNKLSSDVQAQVTKIMLTLGAATLVLGALLAFSGINIPLGIGLMAVGALSIGTAIALNWDTMNQKISKCFSDAGGSAYNLLNPLDRILHTLDTIFNRSWRLQLQSMGSPMGGGLGGGIAMRAGGGTVPTGQMFMARESGPELVGTIGGQTAVLNNDQIVAAVSDGVYRAVSAAMGSRGDTQVKVYLDSREIKAGQQRLARANG